MNPSDFWKLGDYGIVGDLWASPGRDLAARLDIGGREVVDLATGTGVTAIAMAQRGAKVIGVDITPDLLAEAARRATAAGVDVRWVEADVEAVPLPSGSAEVVTSTFGLIFAADPRRAVDEARRLTRPGGDVVFSSWSPSGLFGAIRRTMADYFPDSPTPWHESPQGIREVVGDAATVDEWSFELAVESAESFVGLMERWSAPILVAAETLGPRWAHARERLVEVVAEAVHLQDGAYRADVPYLVTRLTA